MYRVKHISLMSSFLLDEYLELPVCFPILKVRAGR